MCNILFFVSGLAQTEDNILTVCVQGTCDFSLIQDAIESASDGSIINVYSGIYTETLLIQQKSILIQGIGTNIEIVANQENAFAITIESNDPSFVQLENLKLSGELLPSPRSAVVNIRGNSQVRLKNIEIINMFFDGLKVSEQAEVHIEDSQFIGLSDAIVVEDSAIVRANQVLAFNNGNALVFGGSSQVILEGFKAIQSNASGILGLGSSISGSARLNLKDSFIQNSGFDGITIQKSVIVDIVNTSISDSSQAGIRFDGFTDETIQARIVDSQIFSNGFNGIIIDLKTTESKVQLINNEIYANQGWGVRLNVSPCVSSGTMFLGSVSGFGNRIEEVTQDISSNTEGIVCPSDINFLVSTQGGAVKF